jgi:pimeloyl-ACP methyl ester carboxylesterase
MPTPVVLVHGLRGSSDEWETQRDVLEAHGHRVVAVDLPGHGARIDEPFSIAESLVTVADAVRSLGTAPVFVVGRGLGGHLAVECGSLIDTVGGVVAIGCGTQALSWVLDSYRIASTSTHHMLPDGGAALSSAASSTFVRAASSGAVAPSEHFADTLRQLDTLDTRAALSRLQTPVWLLNGQFDRFRMQERVFLAAAADHRLVRQGGVRLAARFRRPLDTARLLLGILEGRHPTRSRAALPDR